MDFFVGIFFALVEINNAFWIAIFLVLLSIRMNHCSLLNSLAFYSNEPLFFAE